MIAEGQILVSALLTSFGEILGGLALVAFIVYVAAVYACRDKHCQHCHFRHAPEACASLLAHGECRPPLIKK
jgi:hypothetical protein